MPNQFDSILTPTAEDLLKRYGITRDEVIEEAGRALSARLINQAGQIDELVTIPLSIASTWSGLTRDEVRRRAGSAVIDHGNRNQRITIAGFKTLIAPKK